MAGGPEPIIKSLFLQAMSQVQECLHSTSGKCC